MARLSDRVVTGAPNGVLSNDEPIQWYAADGITLIDGIKVDPTDAVYLAPAGGPTKVGGDLDVTGEVSTDGKFVSLGNTAALPAGTGWGVYGSQPAGGATVFGKGSVDDVQLLNGSGLIALSVPTGTTNVDINGSLDVSAPAGEAIATFSGNTGAYNPADTNGLQIGFNYSAGATEVAFINSFYSASRSFEWLQATSTSNQESLMTLTPTGDLSITGNLDVTNAGTATAKISATGTGGANQSTMKFYNEGSFKGQIGYREASDDFEIWSQNGSLPTMTMDVGNNVDIPNGNLGVTGSTNLGAPSNTSGRLNIENAGNAAIQIRSGGSIQMRPTANDFDWRFKQEGSSLNFYQGADLVTPVVEMKQAGVDIDGALDVTGALSKGSGSFRIDHPLKPETHQLVHSFTESPQADLLYSGSSDLVDGAAKINLDEFHGMTEGTFVALNRNIRVFTTNETDWEPIRGSVSGNILTISCRDDACTDKVSWLVIGERQDDHMMDTDWTDEQGRVIVEPRKRVIENA